MGVDSVKSTYEVRDYTLEGKLLCIASSSSKEYLRYEGPAVWYNDEGKIIRKGNYKENLPIGEWTEYYNNGQCKQVYTNLSLAERREWRSTSIRIINSWDSLGHPCVVNGNGEYISHIDSMNVVKNKIKNGLPDGDWNEYGKDGQLMFSETYAEGKFIKGIRYNKNGSRKKYTEIETPPSYRGGASALGKFLRKNVRYPQEAMYKKESGTVVVKFTVDVHGNIVNVGIANGVSESLNEEAMRVIKLMPPWKPGIQRGENVEVQCSLPIRFSVQ